MGYICATNHTMAEHISPLDTIKKQLQDFVLRYYRVRLFRGLLLLLAIGISVFMLVATLEYYGRFNTPIRALLFFFLVFVVGYIGVTRVVKPLLAMYFRNEKHLNVQHASQMIGKHFPEIGDKLLNALQLEEQYGYVNNKDFLMAAVKQKTEGLHHIPFHQAIDLSGLKKMAKYSTIPLLFFAIISITHSRLFTEGSKRVFLFNTHFAIPAPYDFQLEELPDKVFKHEDVSVKVTASGKQLPENVYLVLGGNPLKMETVSIGSFEYLVRNVQQDFQFYVTDGTFQSELYSVHVVAKPVLNELIALVEYPSYLGKTNEKWSNVTDMLVPTGTKIKFQMHTQYTSKMVWGEQKQPAVQQQSSGLFEFDVVCMKDLRFPIYLLNPSEDHPDSLLIHIKTIGDESPGIVGQSQMDSTLIHHYYLFGYAFDDHGISKMSLFYRSNHSTPFTEKSLPLKGGVKQDFFLHLSLKELGVTDQQPHLEYYFKVWDNDKVNGPKSAQTPIQLIRKTSDDQLKERAETSGKAIASQMQQAIQRITEQQKKWKDAEKELIQKKTFNWDDQQKWEKLLEEQEKLQKDIEKLKEDIHQRNDFEQQFKDFNQELLDKQKMLNELMNQLLDKETLDLMDKLKEMLKQQQKDRLKDEVNKLNKNNKDKEQMLDKALEQFKQLELEKKINETADKMTDLSKEQKDLKKETDNSNKADDKALKDKQDNLNQKFEQIQKDLQDIDLKNKNLKSPLDLQKTEEKSKEIQQDMKSASDQLGQHKKKNAGQKQQDAAEKMENLAKEMKDELEKSQKKQQEEDYHALRVLLKNLVLLSRKQEDILTEFKTIKDYNPRYISLSKQQKDARTASLNIEDSLIALAKRQPMVSSYVIKETGSLVHQMESAIQSLSERLTPKATTHQQYAMTHANNLAVFLTEVLKQMQEQMNQSNSKDKKEQEGEPNATCDNPGKGDMSKSKPKPGMTGMKELQDRLNKMLEDMENGMKDGQMPGSEEFARIAAQQEALRKELQKVEESLREKGEGGSELANELAKTRQLMEQTETDLYHKKMNKEMMKRQKNISHRMFEHEKAEREQGEDEKRKGETAQAIEKPVPPSLQKYLKEKEKELEFFRTLPPEFNPYYKEKVREYFDALQQWNP
jgi:hypothetical protein